VLQNVVELLGDNLNDFALINDTIERISHFMGYGRVDKRKQFTLGSGRVIKDLLGDVYEANHKFSVFTLGGSNFTFFDLEKLKLGNILVIDAFHRLEASDDDVKVFRLPNHFGYVILGEFFLKSEYFLVEITYWHVLDITKSKFSLFFNTALRILVTTDLFLFFLSPLCGLILRILEEINHFKINIVDILFILLELRVSFLVLEEVPDSG
jgi:hypothetical protein